MILILKSKSCPSLLTSVIKIQAQSLCANVKKTYFTAYKIHWEHKQCNNLSDASCYRRPYFNTNEKELQEFCLGNFINYRLPVMSNQKQKKKTLWFSWRKKFSWLVKACEWTRNFCKEQFLRCRNLHLNCCIWILRRVFCWNFCTFY